MSNKADISLSKLQDEVERMCEDREEGEIDEVRNEPGPARSTRQPEKLSAGESEAHPDSKPRGAGEGILPGN